MVLAEIACAMYLVSLDLIIREPVDFMTLQDVIHASTMHWSHP